MVADGHESGGAGDGITRGLTGQRRGAGHTGVDLDDGVFKGIGVQGELAVAAAVDAESGNDFHRGAAEHLIFFIGEGHRRSDNDGVPGVNADGVDIFHGADGHHVIGFVAHDFKFNFLPPGHGAFDEHLMDGGSTEAVFGDLAEFRFVLGHAATAAAQRKGGTDDNGIADFVGEAHRRGNVVDDQRGNTGLTDGFHAVLEALAVFGLVDGGEVGPEHGDVFFFKEAFLGQLHPEGKTHLPAEGGEETLGFFLADDAFHHFGGERFDVDFIGDLAVGHDGGGVGVDQHHFQPFFFQRAAGLGTGVVEFRGLTDNDGAGTDDENFFDVFILRHGRFLLSRYGPYQGNGRRGSRGLWDPRRLRGGTERRKRGNCCKGSLRRCRR